MVGSRLAQGTAATTVGTNTGELARPESAGEPVENYPAGARRRGTVHQRPAPGKAAEVGMGKCSLGYAEASGVWHAETGIEVCCIAW